MTHTSFAIADLQSRWHTLNDLDRAQAIKSIYQSGMSLRNLASRLNCSPSLLTHLLQAAQAPIEDQVLARQGELSTRHSGARPRRWGLGASLSILRKLPSRENGQQFRPS